MSDIFVASESVVICIPPGCWWVFGMICWYDWYYGMIDNMVWLISRWYVWCVWQWTWINLFSSLQPGYYALVIVLVCELSFEWSPRRSQINYCFEELCCINSWDAVFFFLGGGIQYNYLCSSADHYFHLHRLKLLLGL